MMRCYNCGLINAAIEIKDRDQLKEKIASILSVGLGAIHVNDLAERILKEIEK